MTTLLRHVCALVLFPAALSAASISGRVLEPNQVPASKARVTLLQPETGQQWATTTTPDGNYRFDDVVRGRYLLTVEFSGFSAPPREISLVTPNENRVEPVTLELDRVRTEVVVTAAATAVSADSISRALDVVRQSDWQSRGVSTLSEAVQQVPGLRVQSLGGPGGFTRILLRGLPAQDTAITVDGLRFRDAATTQGDASSFTEGLMLANSQRVEVLRGSGSALYGTNAVGGVVNIVTDDSADRWRASLTGEGGGLGYGRGLLQLGGPLSHTLSFTAGLQHTNVSGGLDGQDPLRNTSLQSGLLWRPRSTVSLTGRVYGADAFVGVNDTPFSGPATVLPARGIVHAVPITLDQQRRVELGGPIQYTDGANLVPNLNDPDSHRSSRFLATAVVFRQQLAPRLSYRISYQNVFTRRKFEDGPAGVRFEPAFRTEDLIRGQVDTLQARADFSASPKWTMGGGYELEREDYQSRSTSAAATPLKSVSLAGQRSNALIGYAEGRMWHDRLHISLAGRLQRFDLRQPAFDGGASPYLNQNFQSPPIARTVDAGISWFLARSGTKLRAHAGNGYRSPSLYERFGSSFTNGTFTPNGDPRLRPDRTLSLDAGIDQYLAKDRVRVSATSFYTDLREVIAFDSSGFLSPATDPYKRSSGYINTSGGIARGAETQAEITLPHRIRWTTSYTYTNSSQRRSTVRDNDYFRSTFVVPHQFTSVLSVPVTRRFDVTASAWLVSSHVTVLSRRAFQFDGARKLDVAASYRIPTEKAALRLQLRATNILNSQFLENGFRTPGFWATAGFSLAF